MLYIILIIVALLCLCYVLFAPLHIAINTDQREVRACFGRLAEFNATLSDGELFMFIRIAWWKKQVSLSGGRNKKQRVAKAKGRSRLQMRPSTPRILAVVRSFTLPVCDINIDMGDESLNGWLYPVAYAMSRVSRKNIRVNFQGVVSIRITIENTIGRILIAFASKGRFQKRIIVVR